MQPFNQLSAQEGSAVTTFLKLQPREKDHSGRLCEWFEGDAAFILFVSTASRLSTEIGAARAPKQKIRPSMPLLDRPTRSSPVVGSDDRAVLEFCERHKIDDRAVIYIGTLDRN
jgi:hypothetical protein